MRPFVAAETPVLDEVFNVVAYLPTKSQSELVDTPFIRKLTDRDFMWIGFLLAKKRHEEGG